MGSDDDYNKAVNWDFGRFGLTQETVLKWRVFFIVALWLQLCASLMTNRVDWCLTYATEWGMHIGYIHLFYVLRAGDSVNAMNVDVKKKGLILTEMAVGFNIWVTIIFWIVLAPTIFTPALGWTGYDLFIRVYMTTIHTFPLIGTLGNLIISDVTLIEEDWWRPAGLWAIYCVVDYIAVKIYGHELYPHWDWTDITSVYLSIAMTFTVGLIYYVFALVFNHFAKN